jgi:hypothetical protein
MFKSKPDRVGIPFAQARFGIACNMAIGFGSPKTLSSFSAFQDKFSSNPTSGHQSILSTARFRKAIFCRLKPSGRIVGYTEKWFAKVALWCTSYLKRMEFNEFGPQ